MTDRLILPRALGLAALVAGALTVACAEAVAPAADSAPGASTGQSQPSAAPGAGSGQTGEPATVADLFPPGPGREPVLNSCGSCHNIACSVIGQRTRARWEALKESHQEKITGSDLNVMFEYLTANFDNTRPEPRVPPRFLEGGCTPF